MIQKNILSLPFSLSLCSLTNCCLDYITYLVSFQQHHDLSVMRIKHSIILIKSIYFYKKRGSCKTQRVCNCLAWQVCQLFISSYNLSMVATACSTVYAPAGANSFSSIPVIIPLSRTEYTASSAQSDMAESSEYTVR